MTEKIYQRSPTKEEIKEVWAKFKRAFLFSLFALLTVAVLIGAVIGAYFLLHLRTTNDFINYVSKYWTPSLAPDATPFFTESELISEAKDHCTQTGEENEKNIVSVDDAIRYLEDQGWSPIHKTVQNILQKRRLKNYD